MKMSELPLGAVVRIDDAELYKKTKTWGWVSTDNSEPDISLEAMDLRDDVTIISVPYEVTLKLAEWLDNVYTKNGNPESLVIEAAQEAAKTEHDAHISDRPKKG